MNAYNIHNQFRNNVLLKAFFNAVDPNIDPSPSFDLEINKEDKDADIDNPLIQKDPRIDNTEEEDPHPDKNN